jgi:hypothetical protein
LGRETHRKQPLTFGDTCRPPPQVPAIPVVIRVHHRGDVPDRDDLVCPRNKGRRIYRGLKRQGVDAVPKDFLSQYAEAQAYGEYYKKGMFYYIIDDICIDIKLTKIC